MRLNFKSYKEKMFQAVSDASAWRTGLRNILKLIFVLGKSTITNFPLYFSLLIKIICFKRG